MDKHSISVGTAAVLWLPYNAILMLERRKNATGLPEINNPGCHELIGGKDQMNDTEVFDTVLRELGEEVCIMREHLADVWRVDTRHPRVDLPDGRRLTISRGFAVIDRLPEGGIRLREGRSDHVRAWLMGPADFYKLANAEKEPESGNFVPDLEGFLHKAFKATNARGCIIDAIAPGAVINSSVVVLSSDGRHVLSKKGRFVSQGSRLGENQHIDDFLRAKLPVLEGEVRKTLVMWQLKTAEVRANIAAKLGWVLSVNGLDSSTALPPEYQWHDIGSTEIASARGSSQKFGFRRTLLNRVAELSLRPLPPIDRWLAVESLPLRPNRSSVPVKTV